MNERVMLTVIIINTLLLFISGFCPGALFFEWSDCLFTVIFLLEAIVKLRSLGSRSYFSDAWNVFDFIILVLALPSLAYPFVDTTIGSSALLAFRALRVFKTFRLFHFIPNIGKLLQGLRYAIQSSLLVTAAYAVFLLVFSILTSSLFGRYAPQYFGDPLTSLFSTFQLFTIEGWYELPNAVARTGGVVVGNSPKPISPSCSSWVASSACRWSTPSSSTPWLPTTTKRCWRNSTNLSVNLMLWSNIAKRNRNDNPLGDSLQQCVCKKKAAHLEPIKSSAYR